MPTMRPFSWLTLVSWLALAAGVQACAGGSAPTPGLAPADVVAAEQSDTLDEIYTRVTTRLAAPDLSDKEAERLRALQSEVGGKLARQLTEEVRRTLEETPPALPDTDPTLLPESVLIAQRARIEPMRTWSEPAYRTLSDEIGERMKQTRAAITAREGQLAAIAPDNLAGRLQVLEQLTALAGPGSEAGEAYAADRRAIVAELAAGAEQAIEAEDYDEARRLLEAVAVVDPTDADTQERLADVNTKVFERDFFHALEQGDPDRGYALLLSVAETGSFPLIKPRLASSSDAMAKYYVALGAEATAAGDVPTAYERFSQARRIRALLGDGSRRPPPEEAPFIALLEREYETARKDDRMGLAWGYLNVIQEMSPESPTLRRQMRETRELVLQRAIKRLSVSSFEMSEETQSEFGDAVASKVVQHLFEKIPNDVRMIEREQLSDIMREKSIGSEGGTKDAEELAAADYLVQGTILEAKVDSIDKHGKQTRRVVTETIEQRNPEYDAWLNLSSKEREKRPEPPKTVMAPRREDITIEVTVHRKVGLFSVSFRLIDAHSAKVIFADSARAKAEHEDTSSEGVELGDFKLEFKLASLPSDTEILTQLADDVSAEIGAKLAEVLANPEDAYRQNAERFVEEANYEAAAQQFAYAIVLADDKEREVEPMLEQLREVAIQSSAH